MFLVASIILWMLNIRNMNAEVVTQFSILENSQVANARFQAAGAIRDAAIREWAFLTAEDRRSLIRYFSC